jgi:hypothetical protein
MHPAFFCAPPRRGFGADDVRRIAHDNPQRLFRV